MKVKRSAKIVILLLILVCLSYGVFKLYKSLFPSKDVVAYKERLEENKKLIDEQNSDYEVQLLKDNETYRLALSEMDDKNNNLEDTVSNLNVSFVGDSVMLGAVRELAKTFPNSYRDAETSRSLYVGLNIIEDLQNKGTLGDAVVINLGANGDCRNGCKESFMDAIDSNKEVFWLTVTDDYKVSINDKLKALAEQYDNLHIIDWEQLSKGHEDWFYADGIHLPGPGRKAYAEVIYNYLCDFYKDKIAKDKEELIKKHEEELKEGLEIFGNDLFISIFDQIKDDYKDAKINANSDYKYSELYNDLKNNKDTIKNKVLLAFDKSVSLNKKNISEVFDVLGDRKVYVISLDKDMTDELKSVGNDNLIVLELSLDSKEDYLVDKKHLNDKGNEKLIKIIKENFKMEDANK